LNAPKEPAPENQDIVFLFQIKYNQGEKWMKGGENMTQSFDISQSGNEKVTIRLTPHQKKVRDVSAGQHLNVFNVVEMIAREKVADMMVRMDICTCSKCACDVLALALNSLPVHYVTSAAGKQYIQLNTYKKQFETDVEIALMKACLTVKKSPNHQKY